MTEHHCLARNFFNGLMATLLGSILVSGSVVSPATAASLAELKLSGFISPRCEFGDGVAETSSSDPASDQAPQLFERRFAFGLDCNVSVKGSITSSNGGLRLKSDSNGSGAPVLPYTLTAHLDDVVVTIDAQSSSLTSGLTFTAEADNDGRFETAEVDVRWTQDTFLHAGEYVDTITMVVEPLQ
ncbi:MAG: hypothetical protein AAF742_00340 [Pseudomonadota bacterium]